MGLFKSIKKIGKKILKGAKKVFKKVGKVVGKVLKSKWGKALLIAAAVTMGGLAIYGAMSGMAQAGAGATFMGKFAAGAKGMMGALASPVATGKAALGVGEVASAAGGAGALGGASGAGAITPGAGSFFAQGAAAAPAASGAASFAPAAGTALSGGAGTGVAGLGAGGGSLLSKAGAGVMNFAKSAGGGQMIAGAVKGFAEGKAAEDQREYEEEQARYYDNQWNDQDQLAAFRNSTGGKFMAGQRAVGPSPTQYVNQPKAPGLLAQQARG